MAQAGQGSTLVSIAVVNAAKTPLDVPLDKLVAATQKAYNRDFLPVWGYAVNMYVTKTPRPSDWQIVLLDDADTAGALGYHDLTINGQPISKVFVKTTKEAGEKLSVTFGHELYEMVIDPLANLWAQNTITGELFAYEMSDPVEEDEYIIDGIAMSNFVHPSYFESFAHPKGTKFDHLGLLVSPFSMTKGGYLIKMSQGKIKEVFGSADKAARFAKEDRRGHRSEYRKLPLGGIVKV